MSFADKMSANTVFITTVVLDTARLIKYLKLFKTQRMAFKRPRITAICMNSGLFTR